MRIQFDIDAMTLGEVEEFEELTGLDIGEVAGGRRTAKAMTALLYIQQRRSDPTYTLEDARAVKLGDLEVGVEDPPEAAPDAS